MGYEQIKVEVSGGVMEITLNRPDRLNAWTGQMGHELITAFDASDADDDVRAVIVTGAGVGSARAPTSSPAARPSTTGHAVRPTPCRATTAAN